MSAFVLIFMPWSKKCATYAKFEKNSKITKIQPKNVTGLSK